MTKNGIEEPRFPPGAFEVEDDTTGWDGYPVGAWQKPSLAVVACDGMGNGVVVWTAGPHLRMEFEENCLDDLSDLGLDDAPRGISVWEGRLLYPSARAQERGEGPYTKGEFRDPTEKEWAAIREGRCPWNDQDWR